MDKKVIAVVGCGRIARIAHFPAFSKMENVKMTVSGRHDPCIVPRAVPVFEAALAITLLDATLD